MLLIPRAFAPPSPSTLPSFQASALYVCSILHKGCRLCEEVEQLSLDLGFLPNTLLLPKHPDSLLAFALGLQVLVASRNFAQSCTLAFATRNAGQNPKVKG